MSQVGAAENSIPQLTEQLYRQEAGRMVAVLTRVFGLHNLELAEDVVQEAFAKALQDWPVRLPENPAAWLMQTAKNKAIDIVRRYRYQQQFAQEVSYLLKSEYTASHTLNQLFLDHEIQDSQLRMIFACCHPALGEEEQILLTLKTCTGLDVEEAANALLMNYEAAKKRLQRAKAAILEQGITFEIPSGASLGSRLDNVLRILYLLFNEGYKSSTKDEVIRRDLCHEAMRLTILLTEHPLTQVHQAFALLALMCFQVARFDARLDEEGEIILLEEQDRGKWDMRLRDIGLSYFERSAFGNETSDYFLQALIALQHLQAANIAETNWTLIYGAYVHLAARNPSPVVLLNKAIVSARVHGAEAALAEFRAIPKVEALQAQNYLFPATLADIYEQMGDREQAGKFLQDAIRLAPTPAEKRLMKRKLDRN
ncbi:MAG: sigma-70 family RNA polymerase sigma factor [Bacteroidia bacterium]